MAGAPGSMPLQRSCQKGRIRVTIAGVRGCADPCRHGDWVPAARIRRLPGGGRPGIAAWFVSAPSSSRSAWCSSPPRSARCSISLSSWTSAAAGLIALGALVAMALYNTISNRLTDRRTLGDQIADLSRGTADLARQVAEMARRLNAMEAQGRQGGGPRARRGRSARRRDGRTGHAGAPDRRDGRLARRRLAEAGRGRRRRPSPSCRRPGRAALPPTARSISPRAKR